MEFFTYHLPNGIRLIHKQIKSNIAHCGIFINAGSRDEEESEHGMAHFLEHAIFKGTTHRKAYHILSRLDDVGGDLNAYTTKEETVVHASFLKTYSERSFELLSDLVFHSTFPEKEIEREKDVILDEINSTRDNPGEQIYDDFEDLIFRGHSLGRSILGTPEKIKSYSREDALRFVANNYHTDQIVISSVSSFKPERIVKIIDKYFGNIPENLRQKKRTNIILPSPRLLSEKYNTIQTHCIIGCPAYDYNNSRRLALILLSNLLGGPGMNSRLNLALRERNGLTYSIESSYTPYSDTGIFCVYFALDNEDLDKATSLVMREFKQLRETKLGNIQLHKAKRQLIGQLAISAENNESLMLSIGKSHLLYEHIDTLKEVYTKIETLTASDLQEVANELLVPENLSTLIFHA
jgi:predicted Zn-dependent peptidase